MYTTSTTTTTTTLTTTVQVPFWPDQIHWYIGLTAWICALINMYLGLSMDDWWPEYVYVSNGVGVTKKAV